ncbi:hypothetical protein AK812_SmicGene45367, partial [Symbiodinium microadriaticum]
MDGWGDEMDSLHVHDVEGVVGLVSVGVSSNCVVKDKVTQLKLSAEVRPDASKVQRSRTTGVLHIDMPLLQPHQVKNPKAPAQPELEPLKPAAEPQG